MKATKLKKGTWYSILKEYYSNKQDLATKNMITLALFLTDDVGELTTKKYESWISFDESNYWSVNYTFGEKNGDYIFIGEDHHYDCDKTCPGSFEISYSNFKNLIQQWQNIYFKTPYANEIVITLYKDRSLVVKPIYYTLPNPEHHTSIQDDNIEGQVILKKLICYNPPIVYNTPAFVLFIINNSENFLPNYRNFLNDPTIKSLEFWRSILTKDNDNIIITNRPNFSSDSLTINKSELDVLLNRWQYLIKHEPDIITVYQDDDNKITMIGELEDGRKI